MSFGDLRFVAPLAAMRHSPFVAILKLCCQSPKNAPNQQIRALLYCFAAASYLFQAETAASPLDALLESLSAIKGRQNLEAILSFLDEAVARCVRGPFKYLDDYAEVAVEVRKRRAEARHLPPVSPIVLTLVEQWKFFVQSRDHSSPQKACGAEWLLRLLQSCAFLGENRYVLAALVGRLMADSGDTIGEEGLVGLKSYLENGQGLEIVAPKDLRDGDSAVGIRDLFAPLPARSLNLHIVPALSLSLLHGRIEASVFDLAVIQRAIAEIVESIKIFAAAEAAAAMVKLNDLMKNTAFQLISKGDKIKEMTKSFLIKEGCCLGLFCSSSNPPDRVSLVVELSHGLSIVILHLSPVLTGDPGYANLLSTIFQKNDPISDASRNKITSNMLGFIEVFEVLAEDELPKVNEHPPSSVGPYSYAYIDSYSPSTAL